MKKVKVFVNNDLDSAGAMMLIKWALGDKYEFDISVSNVFNIKGDYERFVHSVASNAYAKIFIVNMLPDFEVEDNTYVFTKCGKFSRRFKGKVAEGTSTTDLVRSLFRKSLANMTDSQAKFADTINALYVDGGKKSEAIRLNAIFSHRRNKYSAFYDRFADGMTEYTADEVKIINGYTGRLTDTYKTVKIHMHTRNKGMYLAVVDNMEHKYEMLDLLFKKLSPKMVFLVDISNGLISARKDADSEFDMQRLCDTIIEGRALCNCAGGRFTEDFVEFSKAFR